MAASSRVVRTDIFECDELHGAIVRLITRSRVVGLPVPGSLTTLLTALATSGIPLSGTALSGYPNLVLTQRLPKIVDGDPSTIDIDLVYEVLSPKNRGQSFDAPLGSVAVGEVHANIQQVQTQIDIFGEQITAAHRFPNGEQPLPYADGELVVQPGIVTAFVPRRTLTLRGLKNSARPWILANAIIGKINSSAWSGGGPHEWLCSDIFWSIYDRKTTDRYRMEFQFMHNEDTWDPQLVYIDARTGKPPLDLVQDVGYKKIRVHGEIAFESILGTRMQGG